MRKLNKTHSAVSKPEVPDSSNGSEHSVNGSLNEKTKDTSTDHSSNKEINLFDIVSFQKENFVQSERPPPRKYYDTIIW